MSESRKITLGVINGVFLVFISAIVTLVQLRIIIEGLPNDMVGIWFLFLTIGGYLVFLDLGVGPTIGREISFIVGRQEMDVDEKQSAIAAYAATCQRIFLILAMIVFWVGAIGGGVFVECFSNSKPMREIYEAWLVFIMGVSLNLLGNSAFAVLFGLGDVAIERFIRACSQIFGLILTIGALHFELGLIGLAWAWVLQNISARAVGWIVLVTRYSYLKNIGKPSIKVARQISGPSLKWAATALGGVLILQTDNIIIAATVGISSIPAYEAAAKALVTIYAVSMLVVTSTSPFISQAYSANNSQQILMLLYRSIRISMSLMIVLGSSFVVFSERIIGAWIGSDNFVGMPVVVVLCVTLLLEVHHVTLATAVMATAQRFFVKVAFIAGVINIIVSWWLSVRFGLIGVALGTLIAQLLTNCWYVSYISLGLMGVNFREYTVTVLLPLIKLLLATSSINLFVFIMLENRGNLFVFFVSIPIAMVAGAGLVLYLVLTGDERAGLVRQIKKYQI